MNRKSEIQAKYDAKSCKRIALKLNIKTDADVLARFDELKNQGNSVQGYIKSLVREDIAKTLEK